MWTSRTVENRGCHRPPPHRSDPGFFRGECCALRQGNIYVNGTDRVGRYPTESFFNSILFSFVLVYQLLLLNQYYCIFMVTHTRLCIPGSAGTPFDTVPGLRLWVGTGHRRERMSRILPVLVTAWCILAGAAAAAQSPPATESAVDEASAGTEDIEELVRTLEDPQAREELIGQLKVLLEAQKQQSEGPPTEPTSVVDLAGEIFTDVRDRVLAIEPRRALVAGTASAAILIGAFLLRWLLRVLMRKLYARLTGPGRRRDGETGSSSATGEEADTERAGDENRRQAAEGERVELPGTLTRLLTLIIAVAAVILIAGTWGAGIGGLLATDIGSRLAETAVAVGLIIIVTAVLWNAADLVIQRLLRVATRSLDRERTARRLDTLVPLLRSVLQATIGVLAALLLLSELGVNIGPLLAGAGILGLAIGFGAQTLVKDLITGVTILLEDGATVGDVVEVAGHAGVVEEMRIRVIQLRDLAGNVHLVPYSDVTTIKNFTKEFSYYLFEIGVAYREDRSEEHT